MPTHDSTAPHRPAFPYEPQTADLDSDDQRSEAQAPHDRRVTRSMTQVVRSESGSEEGCSGSSGGEESSDRESSGESGEEVDQAVLRVPVPKLVPFGKGSSRRRTKVDVSDRDERAAHVSTVESRVTSDRLAGIARDYFIPDFFELRAPHPSERADQEPREGELCVYEDMFMSGFRLPIHPVLMAFFSLYGLTLTQFTPNSFRTLVGFLSYCHVRDFPPSLALLRTFLHIRKHNIFPGWFYVAARANMKLFSGLPESVKGWKGRFFFVRFKSGESWEVPTH